MRERERERERDGLVHVLTYLEDRKWITHITETSKLQGSDEAMHSDIAYPSRQGRRWRENQEQVKQEHEKI